MEFPTTVSIIAKVDMQDQLAGFVSNKSWPGMRLQFGGQSYEHRFSRPDEEHRFTVTAYTERGEHDIVMEFLEENGTQGAVEILSMSLNGSPYGLSIYRCEYRPFSSGDTHSSHLYLGWPGRWSITAKVPTNEKHGGVGFG